MWARLTFSNVASTLAVFLALGGVAWAAKTLPGDSVGAAQIKPGAVGSEELADHGLERSDFARGATVGAPGPGGSPGEAGARGSDGPRGGTGDPGPAGDQGCTDLFCPGSDSIGTVVLSNSPTTVDGLSAFSTECTVTCSVRLAGQLRREGYFKQWFATAGPEKRSVSLSINADSGTPEFRFHLADAVPTALVEHGNRFQVTLTVAFVQRVAV
jgi:hypothetical protein